MLNPVLGYSTVAHALSWRDSVIEHQGRNDLVRPVKGCRPERPDQPHATGYVIVEFWDGEKKRMKWNASVMVYHHPVESGDD